MIGLFKSTFKIFIIMSFSIIINIHRISPNLRILICTIAKNENKYIKEFIEHYKKLKINKIIIYDNNDINGEHVEDILKNEIDNNFIKIINFRGLQQPQFIALNECYENYKNDSDWIAFFDIDEFLYIKKYTNILNFLSLSIFKKCQSIIINWKYYGDNNNLYYEPKPLRERFIKEYNIENIKSNCYFYSAAKSIIRGGLKLIWGHFPHYTNNTVNCRANGKIFKNYFSPPQYSVAYIKHYITKSTEEFIERLNRGDVMIKPDLNYTSEKINYYYFLFNEKTGNKLNLFKKYKFIKIKF